MCTRYPIIDTTCKYPSPETGESIKLPSMSQFLDLPFTDHSPYSLTGFISEFAMQIIRRNTNQMSHHDQVETTTPQSPFQPSLKTFIHHVFTFLHEPLSREGFNADQSLISESLVALFYLDKLTTRSNSTEKLPNRRNTNNSIEMFYIAFIVGRKYIHDKWFDSRSWAKLSKVQFQAPLSTVFLNGSNLDVNWTPVSTSISKTPLDSDGNGIKTTTSIFRADNLVPVVWKGLSSKEISKMELEMLDMLGWNLAISPCEFFQWCNHVQKVFQTWTLKNSRNNSSLSSSHVSSCSRLSPQSNTCFYWRGGYLPTPATMIHTDPFDTHAPLRYQRFYSNDTDRIHCRAENSIRRQWTSIHPISNVYPALTRRQRFRFKSSSVGPF